MMSPQHKSYKDMTDEELAKVSSFAVINRDHTCAGIAIIYSDGRQTEPGCCEVHLLPWGHEPLR